MTHIYIYSIELLLTTQYGVIDMHYSIRVCVYTHTHIHTRTCRQREMVLLLASHYRRAQTMQ